MANVFQLTEIAFTQLFNKALLDENNRDGRVMAGFDEQKYSAGINTINSNWRALYDSLSAEQRSQVRSSVHALKRGYLRGKGLAVDNVPGFLWFVTFDLYNRSRPQDPNGPRRCIAVLENWYRAPTPGMRGYSSPEGGFFRHLLYTKNHYDTFQYVSDWPLKDYPGGAYGVSTNAALTFA